MKIIIVSAVYPPEPVVSARTSDYIAKEISKKYLCNITVVAPFPNRPSGEIFKGYHRRLIKHESIAKGILIKRCFSFISRKSNLLSRLLENLSFGISSGMVALTSTKPSIIYANTWPIMATGILTIIAKIKKVPLIISIQDVYPESLITQGRIRKSNFIAQLLTRMDSYISRAANHVIVISNEFLDIYRYSRRIEQDRISVIPNWIDSQMIDIDVDSNTFRKKIGILDSKFLIVYGGNIGVAAGVETVIWAIGKLKDCDDVRLLIAGSGSQLDSCKRLTKKCCNNQTVFYSPWPSEDTSVVLRSADILILPTRGEQSLASVPSKLLSYMLAAKPVIALALPGSETERIVNDSQCGWVINPDNPNLLAEQIRRTMALDKKVLRKKGYSGRQYALKHFSTEACLPKIINIINRCIKNKI